MSNPTQTIVIDIYVVSGTDVVSKALSRCHEQIAITGDHKALMAGFKAGTTPAVIKALEESCIAFDAIAARAAGKGGAA